MLENLSRKERNSTIKAFATSEENRLFDMFYDYYDAKHFASTTLRQSDYGSQGVKISTRSGNPLTDSKKDEDRMLVVSNWCEPVITSIADFTSGTDGEITFDDEPSQDFWDGLDAKIIMQEASSKVGIYGRCYLRYQDNEKKTVKVVEPQHVYEVKNSITGELESIVHYYLISKEDAEILHPELSLNKGDIFYAEEFSDGTLNKYIDGYHVNPEKNVSPYDVIPFFKIQTNSEEKSDLLDVIPLNDELNVTYTNNNEVLKYHAFPIYSPKGSGLKDNVLSITDENFKNLSISPKKIMNFPIERIASGGIDASVIEYTEKIKQDIAVVSQVPLKLLLGEIGGDISGVALERMMSGIIKQAEKRRAYIKKAIKGINKLAVSDTEIKVTLPNMLKADGNAKLDEAIKKESLGISKETIITELGYDYKEEESKREQELDKQLTRLEDEARSIEEPKPGVEAGQKKVAGNDKSSK